MMLSDKLKLALFSYKQPSIISTSNADGKGEYLEKERQVLPCNLSTTRWFSTASSGHAVSYYGRSQLLRLADHPFLSWLDVHIVEEVDPKSDFLLRFHHASS